MSSGISSNRQAREITRINEQEEPLSTKSQGIKINKDVVVGKSEKDVSIAFANKGDMDGIERIISMQWSRLTLDGSKWMKVKRRG